MACWYRVPPIFILSQERFLKSGKTNSQAPPPQSCQPIIKERRGKYFRQQCRIRGWNIIYETAFEFHKSLSFQLQHTTTERDKWDDEAPYGPLAQDDVLRVDTRVTDGPSNFFVSIHTSTQSSCLHHTMTAYSSTVVHQLIQEYWVEPNADAQIYPIVEKVHIPFKGSSGGYVVLQCVWPFVMTHVEPDKMCYIRGLLIFHWNNHV